MLQEEFETLLENYKLNSKQLVNKEELLALAKRKDTVKKVASYSFDSIVKNLSELQLSFSGKLDTWSANLSDEAKKSSELTEAIQLETERLKRCNDVKIASDALYILKEENNKNLRSLEEKFENKFQHIEEQKTQLKAEWQNEQEIYNRKVLEENVFLEKERAKENERYKYDRERQLEAEKDKYEEEKKLLERTLFESSSLKERIWKEREEKLKALEKDYIENKQKIAHYEIELNEEIKKETEKATTEIKLEIFTNQKLISKDEEANGLISLHQIHTLEVQINKNEEEIRMLNEKYNQAIIQISELSNKALNLR